MAIDFYSGDIVEFFDQKRIVIGVVINFKKNKIQVLTESSRQINVSPSRILHRSPTAMDMTQAKPNLIIQLRKANVERNELFSGVNLEELWNLVHGEYEQIKLKELVQLTWSSHASLDHEAALVRAIVTDKIYFSLNADWISVCDEETVNKALFAKKQRIDEEKRIHELAAWLKSASENQPSTPPPPLTQRLLNALKALAANIPDQPDKGWVLKILKISRTATPESVFDLLVKLGVFDIDQNLELIRLNFPENFSKEAYSELQSLCLLKKSGNIDKCIDLRDLDTFTIDNRETKDRDDALSLRILSENKLELGIHITDVAEYIVPDSFLDLEARERSQTLYMPDQVIPMFPVEFSEQYASLLPGEDRRCLSTLVTLTPQGNILHYRITPSVIRVKRCLTYQDVDLMIHDNPFRLMKTVTDALRQKRVEQGAIVMPRPEVILRVNEDKSIFVTKRERETASQSIVSECMILSNWLAATYASERNGPFPYRYQDPPKEPIPVVENGFDPLVSYRQRRLMNRALSSITPKRHFSLGVEAYSTITSPLRRYFDILAQRQLKNMLNTKLLYSTEELQNLLYEIDTTASRTNTIVANRERYWLTKHLQKYEGTLFDAVVLDRFPRRYQVWILDYAVDADIPIAFGLDLQPDQKIKVILERANARNSIFKFRLYE
ncbi:RNB domain-containing ribonuclease [bacterium]|nr:RNB domain-containing ribonuclease [candidate division CSSED10-310 bacterium]